MATPNLETPPGPQPKVLENLSRDWPDRTSIEAQHVSGDSQSQAVPLRTNEETYGSHVLFRLDLSWLAVPQLVRVLQGSHIREHSKVKIRLLLRGRDSSGEVAAMLLNPTHEITLSGLPPDVLDAYVRYKKGTRAIVAWVVQYAPSKYSGARSLPIKELARLAASLTGKIKQLPDVIHFHFKETIAARKRLSKYFKGFRDETLEDMGTVNHEHFTSSLTKIYVDLCAICDQPRRKCKGVHSPTSPGSPARQLGNLYEGLAIDDDAADAEAEVLNLPEECSACQPNTSSCPGPAKDMRLADDDLGNAIEYASALQEVQQIVEEVEQSWSRAAKGDVHFVSAAFMTNVAYATLLRVERRLRDLDEDTSIEALQQKCCMLLDQSKEGDEKSAWHELLEQLAATQQAIEHHAGQHNLTTPSPAHARLQKPQDYIGTEDYDSHRFVTALLENIVGFVRSKQVPSAIVRNGSPAYADLGYMTFHPEEKESKTHLSLGIHLIVKSYTSFIQSLPQPSLAPKGRLTALRLAQSAATSVHSLLEDKNCFPCRCVQTLAFHLQNLEEDLTAFAQQNRWDLYFQSPYISGSHIVEMLDLCHYYGSKLFVYRHYIGALVHSYNVMRQLAGCEEIPLMEYLCEEFRHTFFPGGQRPTRSFRACWTRYIGARIKFKKGHRRNNKDSWCMAIPAHEARKAAGLGVGRNEGPGVTCEDMVFKIKQQDYVVTDAQWDVMEPDGTGNEQVNVLPGSEPSHKLSHMLPMLDKHLASTSRTDSRPPKARLNHFAVFRDCVKVVSEISDATHTDPKERSMNCICFASAILEGGDRMLEARAMGRINAKGACWTKDEREGVLKTTIDAMVTVLGGKSAETWAWDI